MKVTTKTAPVKGIGKPDYSRAVSSGVERAGLYLQYNQQAKMFAHGFNHADAAYPLIEDTGLAIGGEAHLINGDTMGPLPAVIPAGFSLSVIAVGFSFDQDAYIQIYLDNIIAHNFGEAAKGSSIYANKLWDLSTTWYDPPARFAHTFDAKIYNAGEKVLYGGIGLWCIMEAIGTPPWPTTKDCHCPSCGHIQTVSVEDSRITCEKCGWVYMVTVFSSLKYTNRVIGQK